MDKKRSKLQEASLENMNKMKNDLKQMVEQRNQFFSVLKTFCQKKEKKTSQILFRF
jgi:hypothetical protein